MKPLAIRALVGVVWIGLVISLDAGQAEAQTYSHVRIVRLSFVEGSVTVQRPDMNQWAEAPTNTPLQEGFKLFTDHDGFAEVEFENSSTARIGQSTMLEFAQLALKPTGGKVNRLVLHQGYATFNVIPEGDDEYVVTVAETEFTPQGKARFRVDLDADVLLVKVFKGAVEVRSPLGSGTVGQDTALAIRPDAEQAFEISPGVAKDAWDEWVEQREASLDLVRNQSPPSLYTNDVTALLYGWNDLSFHGRWVNLPGYGHGWIPSVGAGWAPYRHGRWCWYPGMGYTWIAGEPWGWLPYHFGEWIYQPGFGWAWLPTGLNAWSPAQVNWYAGSGWVGWAPRSSVFGGGQANCPDRICTTSVSFDTLRNGRPVTPDSILRFGANDGQLIGSPDVQPDPQAMLPGAPVFRTRLGVGMPASGQAGQTPRSFSTQPTGGITPVPSGDPPAPGALPAGNIRTRRVETSSPGIVFNPERQRFENNPVAPAGPPLESNSEAATAVGSTERVRVLRPTGETVRPAPQAGPPAHATVSIVGGERPARTQPSSNQDPGGSIWQRSRSTSPEANRSSGSETRSSSPRATSAPTAPAVPARSEPGVQTRGDPGSMSRPPSSGLGGVLGGGPSGAGSGGGVFGGSCGGGGGNIGGGARGPSGGGSAPSGGGQAGGAARR
jgi:hypothetical protein